jgi:hypothetical protein
MRIQPRAVPSRPLEILGEACIACNLQPSDFDLYSKINEISTGNYLFGSYQFFWSTLAETVMSKDEKLAAVAHSSEASVYPRDV